MPQCQDCGVDRPYLHRHHVIPKVLDGTDDPSNLVSLCANCHEDRHGGPFGGLGPNRLGLSPAANEKRKETLRAHYATDEGRAQQRAKAAQFKPGSRKAKSRGRRVSEALADRTPEKKAEHARKISEAKKGLPASEQALKNLAKGHKPSIRRKAVKASADVRRGVPETDEHREKISTGLRAAYAEGRRQRGHTEETKRKIAEAKRIDRWARDHDVCIQCGRDDSPHKARGVCLRCYSVARRAAARV